MSSKDMDLFAGVIPFVAIAEAMSFRGAAKQLGVTASALSKAITKLEADLGVQLLYRTSRSVTLTTEGEEFLKRCRDAVDQVRAARERASQAQRAPRGVLRVSLPLPLGQLVVMPALPRLLLRHPSLSVNAVLTDRFVQLAEENIDVVVRMGAVEDSSAVTRRLRRVRTLTVASPSYLARHGTPKSPDELSGHNCLRFILPSGLLHEWVFQREDASTAVIRVQGNLSADYGEALVASAVAGLGVIQAFDFMVAAELATGQLIEVLPEYATPGPPISVLYARSRNTSPKVRAFLTFMVELLGS